LQAQDDQIMQTSTERQIFDGYKL